MSPLSSKYFVHTPLVVKCTSSASFSVIFCSSLYLHHLESTTNVYSKVVHGFGSHFIRTLFHLMPPDFDVWYHRHVASGGGGNIRLLLPFALSHETSQNEYILTPGGFRRVEVVIYILNFHEMGFDTFKH